jgi:hypothetical protein
MELSRNERHVQRYDNGAASESACGMRSSCQFTSAVAPPARASSDGRVTKFVDANRSCFFEFFWGGGTVVPVRDPDPRVTP